MPKDESNRELQTRKAREVRTKAEGVLARRGPRAPFAERAKAENALRSVSRVEERLGISKPPKPKGDETPKPGAKSAAEKRREPFERGTGQDKTKRALEGVAEQARKAAEAAKKKE